jgi:hypothetical protein
VSKTCALLCLLFSAFAFAQSTHKFDFVSIDTGDPSWASLYFGDSVTLVGDAMLIIQCDFKRGELITEFHVYGKQMSSDFFPITCTEVNPRQFILDATPFTVNLTMYGYNTTAQNLTAHSRFGELAHGRARPTRRAHWNGENNLLVWGPHYG